MFNIIPMQLTDYDAVMDLMRQTPGVSIRAADGLDATARYLARNPGLSFVAAVDGTLVGCVMASHDGRRGYLQHLLVLPAYRKQGIARALVAHTLAALDMVGIMKSHIDVLKTNASGKAWWQNAGWTYRNDIDRYSLIRGSDANA